MAPTPKPKYVASAGPVNRRTALKAGLVKPQINPVVQERLLAAQQRSRLGSSMGDQVRVGTAAKPVPLQTGTLLGGIIVAVSALLFFIAWLQQSIALAAAGAAGLLAGVAILLRARRVHQRLEVAPTTMQLIDASSLETLDRALERMAPEVPEQTATQLVALKQLIVRIAAHGSASMDETFTLEDRLYLNECVRRYLPDTLESYLKVPKAQRESGILDGERSAAALLSSQLHLLHAELEKREAKLARNAAHQLLQQQRFLESKAKG